MPVVRVSTTLPYTLGLPDGDYATAGGAPDQEVVTVSHLQVDDEATPRTVLSGEFHFDDVLDVDAVERLRNDYAGRLLRRANKLLRWCRAESRRPELTERTRGQASPFTFDLVEVEGPADWTVPLLFEDGGPQPINWPAADLAELVRAGLATGHDPDVDVLFILDAERALQQGRFREAVLFSWSTIDSIFNRRYNALVDAGLPGEWASGRDWLKDNSFGLRNKMSAVMRLVAGRSLFAEPHDFWIRLSTSYTKRNAIIHSGAIADEDDARSSLSVARDIVRIMREVAIAAAEPNPAAGPLLIE